MISADQPSIFDNKLITGVSSTSDGNMRFRVAGSQEDDKDIVQHKINFLNQLGITLEQSVLVHITYDQDNYTRFRSVTAADAGAGMLEANSTQPADALATNDKGIALFLPLADCVGAIIYDPEKDVIMVSHLGRHSTIQEGARKNIEFLVSQYQCSPSDLKVWFSPAVAQGSYRMDYFDHKDRDDWRPFCQEADDGVYIDIAGYNRAAMIAAGVSEQNIEVSAVDTASNLNYPSHVRGDASRFAIVAMMR